MLIRSVWSCLLLVFCLGLSFPEPAQAGPRYSKQEVNLSKVPRRKFHDWRLRASHKHLARQYKNLYRLAADDGYILPNEMSELMFHRRLMKRLFTIDRNRRKAKMFLKRRDLSPDKRKFVQKKYKYFEASAMRFSCRYLRKKYKRWYRRNCKKRR